MSALLDITTHRAVSWRFYLEIDSVTVAEFLECNGLSVQRETKDLQEGGRNNFGVKLPGPLTYSNVTLKRGILDMELLDWLIENADTNTVKPGLRTVTIHLANESGDEAFLWKLYHAYPVKWSGPSFKVDSNELAMEELELTYSYFEMESVSTNRMASAANKLSALG